MPSHSKGCSTTNAWTLKLRLHSTEAGHAPTGSVRVEIKAKSPATCKRGFANTKFVKDADTSGLAKFQGRRTGKVTVTLVFETKDDSWVLATDPTELTVTEGQVISETIDIKMHKLRVILADIAGQPLANHTWALSAPFEKTGTTQDDGLIEVAPFPAKGSSATLSTTPPAVPEPTPPVVAPLSSPPPYPPPIIATQFEDKATAAPTDGGKVEWTATVSDELATGADGVFVRLHNLGYAGDGKSTHTLATDIVKSYQAVVLSEDTPSGTATDIENDITQRHDEA